MEKGFKKGLKKGLEQGLREAIKDVLEVRFEKITPQIIAKLDEIKDVAQLKELHKKALKATLLGEFNESLN